jgi:outer membrane protein TolC
MTVSFLKITTAAISIFFALTTAGQVGPIPSESRESVPTEFEADSSLEEYLAYAALHNTGLEAAFERWKAALERVHQAGVLPDPRFNYGYFIQNVETRVGAQNQRFGVSQTFPWLGKLKLKEDASMAMANMAEQQYEAAKLRLFDEVKQSYFDYYYLGRAIAVTAENVELLKEFERIVRSKYESGSALYADLLKAQVELEKASDRLKTLNDQRIPTVARFNAVLGRNPSAPLPLPTQFFPTTITLESPSLLATLAQNNPDLKRVDYLAEGEQARLDLARREYYPDVTLGVDFVDTNRSSMAGIAENGKDAVMVGFSINLPIWRGKLDAAVAEAGRNRRAAIRSRTDLQNRLSADLELAVFRFHDAERKIELYRDSLIDKAEQNLTATRSAFEAGKLDFLSLIDAEKVLLEFTLNYEQALADREKAISQIERISGTPL